MKISILLLFIGIFSISAKSYSQEAKVSLVVENATINEVFEIIKTQTSYSFWFDLKNLDTSRKVSIRAEEESVKNVLSTLLKEENLDIRINGDHIVIVPKESAPVAAPLQEKRTISGIVTDEQGDPIIGANVIEKGTTMGVITDINGEFRMAVSTNATLLISYIGYLSQEVAVKNQTIFRIVMKEDNMSLEEVVVVGYGTQKKVTLTGSVVAVKGEDIVKSPAMNVLNSLTGRLPGMIINTRSGEPGRDDPEIFIRGKSTTGSQAPLYIIDGVEREGLGRINPADIESITVLKDAEAAIYGARSANGVILVTTKRGKTGKPTISLSFDQGFTQPTRTPNMADAYTFAKVWNETQEYDQHFFGTPPSSLFTQEELDKYRNGTDPYYPNTDWFGFFIKNLTPQHRTNVSVSGGTDRVNYYISFGESMQKGHFNYGTTEARRYNVRSNLDVQVTDWLKVGMDLAARVDHNTYPHWGTFDAYSHLVLYQPIWQPYWPGTDYLYPCRDGDNLINLISDEGGTEKQNYQNYSSSFTATIDVPWVKGLTLNAALSYDSKQEFNKRFEMPTYVYQRDEATDTYTKVRSNRGVDKGVLDDKYNREDKLYFNGRVNYSRLFGDHGLNVMVGYEQEKRTGNVLGGGTKDFISTTLPEINMGSQDKDKWSLEGYSTQWATQSVFGRVGYDYKSKYMAQFTFRYDGSANFPKSKRFGFFPSASAGWRISEEDFMKNFTFLNNLKIRGSYGVMGNDKVDPYQYLTFFGAGNNIVVGGSDVNGIVKNNVPNPIITWETAKTMNVGLEATLWDGFLGVEFDYFNSRRNNILIKRNAIYPDYTGIEPPHENYGRVNNRGFELVLSHANYKNKVQYAISGNVSFARNKIIDIDEAPAAEDYQLATGRPIGSGLYYNYIGVFQNQEQLDSYPAMAGFGIGDPMFEDVNKDGVIDSKDRVRLDNNITPEIVYGLNATVGYNGFDLSVLLQGQERAAKSLGGHFAKLNYTWGNFYDYVAEDRWSLDNPTGTKPRANIQDRGTHGSTLWYTNAGFLRVKNLELGYTLPTELCRRIGVESVRFSVSGHNLFLIYDSMKKWGFDPEVNTDFAGYSQQRTYNVGINLIF